MKSWNFQIPFHQLIESPSRSSGSCCVWTMSRGFLQGLGSNKVPPLLLPDVPSVSVAALLGCLAPLWLESGEILSSSATRSPSTWISCLKPSEAEGRASSLLFSAEKLVGAWGVGETEAEGWGSGGLSLNISPPPPSLDSVQSSSASDSSLSLDDSLLLSLEVLLLSEELLLSSLDTGALLEACCSSSTATILAASSNSSISSSKSVFCRVAFSNVAAKSATFLDLWRWGKKVIRKAESFNSIRHLHTGKGTEKRERSNYHFISGTWERERHDNWLIDWLCVLKT